MRKERIRERGQADNRYANIERERRRVLLTVMPDQLDPCVIGKNADFVTFFFNYVLNFAKNMSIYENWRYNRSI